VFELDSLPFSRCYNAQKRFDNFSFKGSLPLLVDDGADPRIREWKEANRDIAIPGQGVLPAPPASGGNTQARPKKA
jgi:hypothetical protein